MKLRIRSPLLRSLISKRNTLAIVTAIKISACQRRKADRLTKLCQAVRFSALAGAYFDCRYYCQSISFGYERSEQRAADSELHRSGRAASRGEFCLPA